MGENDGQPFFTMRLLEGGTLAQKMAEHRLQRPQDRKRGAGDSSGRSIHKSDSKPSANEKQRQIARFVATVAHAVHHAHQRGILHRDLKPGNILLDTKGEPHVTDFGLAKLLEGESNLTQTHAVLGTPSYMAPEQAAGQTKELATTTDIYSLGAIFYEMLAGQPPFKAGSTLETMRQVIEQAPIPPRILNPQVDRDLETICLKCLEKEPKLRFGSAEALAEDLERWRKGEPIHARPSTSWQRMAKWAKRKPATAALVGVSGLTVLVVMAGLLISNRLILSQQEEARKLNSQLLAERNEAKSALERESKALLNLTQVKEDLQMTLRREKSVAYTRDIALAHREFLANNLARANQILDQCNPELRGWEWRHLARLCKHPGSFTFAGRLGNLGNEAGGNPTVTYTSEGMPVAWYPVEGRLKLLDGITGEQLFAGVALPDAECFAFTLEGNALAYARNAAIGHGPESEVLISNLRNGRHIRRLTLEPLHRIRSLAWSPNGGQIAAGIDDHSSNLNWVSGGVQLWDVRSGRSTRLRQPSQTDCLTFSHDGEILVAGGQNHLTVWQIATRQQLISTVAPFGWSSAFSPDDRLLAVSGDLEKGARIFELSTGQESRVFFGHTADGWAMAFSPDGKLFAAGSRDGSVRIWDVAKREQTSLYRHSWSVDALAFSRDSKKLVVGSGHQFSQCMVWDLADSQEVTALKGSARDVWTVAFSHDSERLASTSSNGDVVIWDINKRKPVLTLIGSKRPGSGASRSVYGVAFSPDGQFIASPWAEGNARDCRIVRLWSTDTGEPVFDFVGHSNVVLTFAFSPDSKRLASSAGRTVRIWDLPTRREAFKLTGKSMTTVVFSPDGDRVAAGSRDGWVRVWDATDGRELLGFKAHKAGMCSVAFSPDGKCLASGGTAEAKLWDSATGQELSHWKGGLIGEVRCLAFSPDGLRLATTTTAVKVWDVATGLEMLTLGSGYNGVAFSANGTFLASGTSDGTVKVWDARALSAEELGIVRGKIPLRSPDLQTNLVDLSRHYNVSLTESWYSGVGGEGGVGTFLESVQRFGGVDFDIRGLVQVGGVSRLGEPYPKQIVGMAAGFPCQRLHFLHAAINALDTPDETQIGSYIVHYANGQAEDIPIVIGRDVADWWNHPIDNNQHLLIAWQRRVEISRQHGGSTVRLFITAWQNPHPDLQIQSIDFLSTHQEAAPFLLALTAE